MKEDPTAVNVQGQLALTLLAVDPAGLGGLHLRARAGPVRDMFCAPIKTIFPKARRIAPSISDLQLFGGVDIGETLTRGQIIRAKGILETPTPLVFTMAERCEPGLAARLAQALDSDIGHALILLDEGAEDDEIAPTTLTERLAFRVDLDGMRHVDLVHMVMDEADVTAAQARLTAVEIPDDAATALAVTAIRFGIDSLRAPLIALAAARANAALNNRKTINQDDLQIAVQLVYAHRATQMPVEDEEEEHEDNTQPDDTPDTQSPDKDESDLNLPDELLIDAVKAVLPFDVLAMLEGAGRIKAASGSSGAGQKKRGNRRGRPLPSRAGRLDGGNRIDLVATLRAAVPWQTIRRKQNPDRTGVLIRPSDIHVKVFQEVSDRLVIFAVDASGSAAVARLSEAKGAVELMLADAYARRDHVALIAFRGESAELILPPTRSLVQTKRRLAGLPGGGGTPLASGLKAAADLAQRVRAQGLSPSIAVLTDGRANVPLPGKTGRAAANDDAQAMARHVRSLNIPSAMIDTSVRPHRDLRTLCDVMNAKYIPLPRADAKGLSRAIETALGA
ncbi:MULTISPECIES: magnesium chelatase subunit D [Marivita]|uniref:Magnesium chelatase subunit D n=1 Tax=Marivita cryptomonadis TaxID=505252 RepID=A0A9Q2PBK7_9RHOB|nr:MULTISPECIES: magnesium chelatase subunit D [Marivita]MCR9167543.1 magnesium chelatase subunit D [Paracoccaceae bacterium]MBM2321924.1 magnesium chelatase subunit D [Marivita cryptomonadis]MBM2331449.1 magnesium chelatase subunit D [Marivita cryptomonadis]MBM2341035.1 magnesium chelatase subunit D [Marivita cryptomonadis]MBM2345697.1 magnesium chelatase subunit D [Marivita cryptomonadis]